MCDPLSWATLALTAGGTLFGLANQPKPPPAPDLPATPAPTARNPGATVRVGTGADELENTDPTQSTAMKKAPTRASGNPLGGLGRSSLAL